MPKLYLVGITEDRSGLVLAKSARAKKGDSVLEVDHVVLDALAEIRRYRSEGTTKPSITSAALPSRRATAGEVSTPSALSPREIQSRLRRGESIQSVSRRAGVEEWRIEVYAAPIAAEQARVVSKARELSMVKRGAGLSGRPLGESVQANVIEKKASMNVDEFESAWIAYEPEPDRWIVVFEYDSRGTTHRAEWMYEEDEENVAAINRLATMLGWRDPRRTGKLAPLPEAPRITTAKKPARRKPAARKPAARKPAARKPARKPAARKPTPKRTPTKKAATKKAATKKAAAKKTARKPAARGAKNAPTRKSPAKRPAAKRPAAKKPAARKTAAKKPAAKKKPAKKRAPAPRQPRHLRIVDAPADVEADQSSGDWRRDLSRGRESDLAPRRSWREQAAIDPGDTDLAPPSWLQRPPRPRPSVPEPAPVEPPPPRPGADATRQVSVDAARVGGRRRSLRRRDRPLRSR